MTDLYATALCTLAEAKTMLGITGTDYDEILTRLINRGTDIIQNYCKRTFDDATYTEKWDGDNTGTYNVKHYPINSITGIYYLVSDYDSDTWDTLDDDFYTYDSASGIVYCETPFHKGMYRNWKITYNGGYATIPQDIKEACVDIVTYLYNKKNSKGIKVERVGDRSVEWFAATGSSIIKELGLDDILDAYRTPTI